MANIFGRIRDAVTWIDDHPIRRGVAVFVAACIGLLAVGALLNWYVSPESASDRKDVATIAAQAVGGIILIVGLYFTWRTVSLNAEQQRLANEGQITDRFSKATEQLGATIETSGGPKPRRETRLGGIHALARLAADSPRDYWPILQVLSAYVRTNAQWAPPNETGKPEPDAAAFAAASLDIQAILTALANRPHRPGELDPAARPWEPAPLNLSRTDLPRVSIEQPDGAHLEEADFRTSVLIGAGFGKAHLRRARLEECRLQHASFEGADLEGACLGGAFVHGAQFAGARLHGADLADVQGLTQDQLDGAFGDANTMLPDHVERPTRWT